MGGGGGSSAKTTTNATSTVELPSWVTSAARSNLRFAQQIANKPLVQYSGQTVADIPQVTQDAWDAYLATLGAGQPQYGQVSDALSNIVGGGMKITPQMVSAMNLPDVDISKYLNPYIANVEDAALGQFTRARDLELMSNADKAQAAGAFGGDRGAVIDAITRSESARNYGDFAANLRKAGYDTATGLAQGDLARQLQAALANQQAGLTADQANIQSILSASSGQLAAQEAARKAREADFAGSQYIGEQQQAHEQQIIDENRAKFEEARDYDLQRLNILLSALGMTPYGRTETSQSTTKSKGGSSGTDWAQVGVGAALAGASIFSDRRMKKDIEKLGKDERTGLDIYAYRYKADKGGPKVVGPMAQDVEKMYPGSTYKIGGKMVIKPEVVGVLAHG